MYVHVVTAPKVFAFAFSIIKKFMDDYTLSKIQIYKADPAKWQARILSLVPKDQLPAHFGGTLRDPDGNPRYTSKVFKFLSKLYTYSTEYPMKCDFDRTHKVLRNKLNCF